MKKATKLSMMAAAVAISAGTLCAVEFETDPVGYLEKTGTTPSWVCNPFNPFAGSVPTIGDISAAGFDAETDFVKIFNENGRLEYKLRYLTAEQAAAVGGTDAGWYDAQNACCNSIELGRGSAVQFSGAGDAKIVFAGKIAQAEKVWSMAKGKQNWIGNASPVAVPLAQIVPNSAFKAGVDYAMFPGAGGVFKRYTYINDAMVQSVKAKGGPQEMTAGWYEWAKVNSNDFSANSNDEVISAGQGFLVVVFSEGVTVSVPGL